MGGGLANLLDRAGDGTVTDFLGLGPWPTFNLADSAICTGAAWFLLTSLGSAGLAGRGADATGEGRHAGS